MSGTDEGPRTAPGGWDPARYERFKEQRAQPFHDLLALVERSGETEPAPRLVDLGCGTGELTLLAHRQLGARSSVGVDASPAMLARAAGVDEPGVSFEAGDMVAFGVPGSYDVVISNAAMQWVPDHPAVLAGWTALLAPGGQLAVQVPANADHPSHLVAAEVAAQEPFLSALGGVPPPDAVHSVLPPERYAELLHDLGFASQHVRLQVYGHLLASTGDIVEWVRGTSLTRFSTRMEPALFERFVERYRARLLEVLGEHTPFFYPYKRILMWGRL